MVRRKRCLWEALELWLTSVHYIGNCLKVVKDACSGISGTHFRGKECGITSGREVGYCSQDSCMFQRFSGKVSLSASHPPLFIEIDDNVISQPR